MAYKYRGNHPYTPDPLPEPEPKRTVQLAPCPSPAAYQRHVRRGERVCDPCRELNKQKRRAYYKAKVEAAGREYKPHDKPVECGTRPGYYRHLRDGDHKCPPCWAAVSAQNITNRKKREARKAANAL